MLSLHRIPAGVTRKCTVRPGFFGGLLASLVLGGFLAGCAAAPPSVATPVTPPATVASAVTAVTQTPVASQASPTPRATRARKKTPRPSPTVTLAATATPSASLSSANDLEQTSTPVETTPPVLTPSPTSQPAAASPTVACHRAAPGEPFDVTIPAYTQLQPGQAFTKVWRLKNTGACAWTADTTLGWFSGFNLGAPDRVSLGQAVQPGGSVDILVDMVAPQDPGTYQSDWRLVSPQGEVFGLDPSGSAISAYVVVASGVTATPTPTATSSPELSGAISGRVLLDGAPAGAVQLGLEDQAYQRIAETSSAADGSFTFNGLQPSATGYNLVFSQVENPQYTEEQVVSWAWIGPLVVVGGAEIQLPDFEIAGRGFTQASPEPEATVSAAGITPGAPLLFAWQPYPGADAYWVDLTLGDDQALVWQSELMVDTSVDFTGTLSDGGQLQPGEYWWAVGAQLPVGEYTQTVYSYLANLVVEP